ncbi:unnamed protein product [Penicillium salamii]|uniref:Fungal N-terminal domain-containing protein n=1 Tax=Penicillium salamii TaxID=1612424 RepID=A0A9W4NQ79_9EURO|nr:unnamed protein product [Penicillium salamii]
MASVSIGDIVLCSQIAYQLLAAATVGRRDAPRDLRELESVLLAFTCSLGHVQEVAAAISSQNTGHPSSTLDTQQHLGFMLRSCRQVLQDLEQATAKYRDTIRDPRSTFKFKSQWRRFMWDLRGESLTRYRKKLETHTAAINLMLNACIWSTANRIETNTRGQNQRMEELLYQASHLNGNISALMHPVASMRDSELHLLALPPALPA